jgi:prepilin-type processing-associated H-X9-DG protein
MLAVMAKLVVVIAILMGCGGGTAGDGDDTPPADAPADPPIPSGCITATNAGDHAFTCSTLQVDARIPAACQAPGCGLILVLHGDTGNGLLMDGHVKLRELGEQHGYIVVAPTGPPFGSGFPGSTWEALNDAQLVEIVGTFREVFRVDAKRIHVTGFSRGAFVTWRLLCDHSELFASAAPAGAGNGSGFGEVTCFSQGRTPARKLPIAFLMGRTDASVGYASLTNIRDAALADYGAGGATNVSGDASYSHDRFTGAGVIETFDHAYETAPDGPFASARGHCIPGSTTDPYAPQYAIPCVLPNAFVWGDEVMKFFIAHPLP